MKCYSDDDKCSCFVMKSDFEYNSGSVKGFEYKLYMIVNVKTKAHATTVIKNMTIYIYKRKGT